MSTRGEHLVRGGLLFVNGSGLLGRLFARSFSVVLDQIDERLAVGGIDLSLPNGSRRHIGFRAEGPVAVVRLHSWYALVRLVTSGSIGWYRAWSKGEWSSPDPVPLFALFTVNARSLGDTGRAKGAARLFNLVKHRRRDNDVAKARENIAAHYDLGNDFYAAWLDRTMTYSSARFASADDSLEAAQLRKVHALLDRLDLQPGQRLLEIGCGWGTLAIEAAKRGVDVVGLTLSTEQKAWADEKIAAQNLAGRVEIRLQDYRDTNEQFDAIASVEMVEAVGQRWWPAYLDCIARNLKPGGRAALQFISIDHAIFDGYVRNPDFIQAYIFPGGCLLNEPAFEWLARERGLSWENREGFRLDYAETLKRWHVRYDEAVEAGRLRGFDDDFHALWRYYLMYCEGGFRGGAIDVAQVTMTKG
ncbi:cyclopropane-fatty-acyl-phospholipid synthase family protein [Sphingomonas sp. SM33]|uniref:Cyclopropane-fatty-acyl-phospholipid synthase family protein n=1 Tax=Sphingomonas telluris TaxID=2907998 RepID=A0ABS9VMT4_9SPHN|nr:cyclopropane-fatty-acyl-phospholipid synthase family protein [Sphingomonas telluris]MCH8616008.1 cyclopropane-fatty-acyl-phospholipid synthase family protein [Sphingomonas telluris]